MLNQLEIGRDESKSLLRPAWTSEQKTGMFEAHIHLHGRALRRNAFTGNYGLPRSKKNKRR